MRVFHIAHRPDWEAAQASGSYGPPAHDVHGRPASTVDCAREDRWEAVRKRHFGDTLVPLVLLTIDTDRLTTPVQETAHGIRVTGPIATEAVVGHRDLPRPSVGSMAGSAAREAARDLAGEVLLYGGLILVFVVCVGGLGYLGDLVSPDGPGSVVGGGLGLVLAVTLLFGWLLRQRRR